jgi:hypothetical protein
MLLDEPYHELARKRHMRGRDVNWQIVRMFKKIYWLLALDYASNFIASRFANVPVVSRNYINDVCGKNAFKRYGLDFRIGHFSQIGCETNEFDAADNLRT